jgi:thiamine-monophosphate kinase
MAAKPWAAVVSLALPREDGAALARQLTDGMLPLAEKWDVALAGGDTNSWDGPLVISVTAVGETTPRGPLLRSGARPGDEIVVTGEFGGSILGKHLDFDPRVSEALLLHERYQLTAGMDVSDGLSLDLSRLAEASGCGLEIELSALPISPAAREVAAREGDARTAQEHALGDGEDFELILTLPPDEARRLVDEQPLGVPVTRIGRCLEEAGLWGLTSEGTRVALPVTGWEH